MPTFGTYPPELLSTSFGSWYWFSRRVLKHISTPSWSTTAEFSVKGSTVKFEGSQDRCRFASANSLLKPLDSFDFINMSTASLIAAANRRVSPREG